MPTNIIPYPLPTFPIQLTVPNDGDPNSAASVNSAFQDILNGITTAQSGLWGGTARRSYRCLDGTNFDIDAPGYVVLTSAGNWYAVPQLTPVSITATSLVGAAPSANTRYYIYTSLVFGILAFTASTTGPDLTLRFQNGGTNFAYIGTFCTDGTGKVKGFVTNHSGWTQYVGIPGDSNTPDDTGFLPGFVGTVTNTWTTVSLEQPTLLAVPPTAQEALVRVSGASTNAGLLYFAFGGNTANDGWSMNTNFVASQVKVTYLRVPLSGNSLAYRSDIVSLNNVQWTCIGFR